MHPELLYSPEKYVRAYSLILVLHMLQMSSLAQMHAHVTTNSSPFQANNTLDYSYSITPDSLCLVKNEAFVPQTLQKTRDSHISHLQAQQSKSGA